MKKDIVPPAISVVVVTRDHYQTLRPIVAALRRQTVARAVELVVVAPDRIAGAIPEEESAPFAAVQVVPVGQIHNRGLAAAAGVRAARAPIVALSENHCFPEREWAERTLNAHQSSWAAVGPSVENANPGSSVSLALHAAGYGAFDPRAPAETREELPLHNTSYRRGLLLEFGDDLEWLLEDERRLQKAILDRGGELYFDPGTTKWHINEATWNLLAGLGYAGGRRYAGTRSTGWPVLKRWTYAIAFPLLSLPIAVHIRRQLPMDGSAASREPWVSLVVWLYALVHAFGEAVSYVLGPRTDFPFVEDDEFLIRERLGGKSMRTEIAEFVSLLDDAATFDAR